MHEKKTNVLDHFEKMSNAFDGIYEGEQRFFLYRIVDMLFRKSILDRRMQMMIALAGDVRNKGILDIGCGPGRYAVSLALSGPRSVLGIDISQEMIELAKKTSDLNNASGICRFERCDFIQKEFNDRFDIVIASGVFDYVADPVVFLTKIKSILRGQAIISFPVKWTALTPVRMAWLYKRRCPNYYYSRADIKDLFKRCGLEVKKIIKIGSFLVPGNYVVVCKSKGSEL